MLNQLHTISGIAILIALLDKIIMHYILDRKQGKVSGIASFLFAPGQYLWRYTAEVAPEYRGMKILCNMSWWLAVASLVANLIIGILIYKAERLAH